MLKIKRKVVFTYTKKDQILPTVVESFLLYSKGITWHWFKKKAGKKIENRFTQFFFYNRYYS